MLGKFRETFEEMVKDRIFETSGELSLSSPKYKKACDEGESLCKRIEALLPDEHKHLLLELDSSVAEQLVATEDVFYRQGLHDGMELVSITRVSDPPAEVQQAAS